MMKKFLFRNKLKQNRKYYSQLMNTMTTFQMGIGKKNENSEKKDDGNY